MMIHYQGCNFSQLQTTYASFWDFYTQQLINGNIASCEVKHYYSHYQCSLVFILFSHISRTAREQTISAGRYPESGCSGFNALQFSRPLSLFNTINAWISDSKHCCYKHYVDNTAVATRGINCRDLELIAPFTWVTQPYVCWSFCVQTCCFVTLC